MPLHQFQAQKVEGLREFSCSIKLSRVRISRWTNLPYLYIASVFSDTRHVNDRTGRRNMSTNRRRKEEDPTASRRATLPRSTSRSSYLCIEVFTQLSRKMEDSSYYNPEHLKSLARDIQVSHKKCWSGQSPSCSIYITQSRTRRCGLYNQEGCSLASSHCHFQQVNVEVSGSRYRATHRYTTLSSCKCSRANNSSAL